MKHETRQNPGQRNLGVDRTITETHGVVWKPSQSFGYTVQNLELEVERTNFELYVDVLWR